MKMKKQLYILLFILSFGFISCDDFLDVNDDPNAVTELSLSAQLPATIEGTSQVHYTLAATTARITQHIGSYFGYPEEFRMGGSWSTIYLRNLNNLQQLVTQSEELNAPHYAGVARTLMALNLGLATDNWENIPYSQAFNGSANLKPAYDAQESIYSEIIVLLNQAIIDLGATSSFLSPGGEDMAYNGDLSKWLQLAYGLKARYQVHLINKNGIGSIMNDLANSFVDNSNDFEIQYNSVNKNPWHVNIALANNSGNVSSTYGAYFINKINGNALAIADPRLPIICDTIGITEIRGIVSYDQNAPESTVDFEENNWYSTEAAPVPMVTFAELKFIEAEAAMSSGNAGVAYDAYLAGIEAHMTKVGVNPLAISDYISNPAIAVGSANLTLAHIMGQKYIALFLNPEAWVDMRRYNYDANIYAGFEIPDPVLFQGPAQRAFYPEDEINRNGASVEAASKPYAEKMWRDQ